MSEPIPLGRPLDGPGFRDAIHVAIFPATAECGLSPGDRVALTGAVAGTTHHVRPAHGDWIGVVDPFLDGPLPPGAKFYVCVRPGTVTGIRHLWSHPAFMVVPPRLVEIGHE